MSPERLKQLKQIADASGKAQGQSKTRITKPENQKNFLVDQISTATGIAGGILGSFASPIVGTGLGAGAGSALGEAIENAITGKPLGDNLVKEAAIGGVLGAGPLKALRATGQATKGAVRGVGLGDDLIAQSRGITPAVGKTATNKGLTTASAKRLNKVADDLELFELTPKRNLAKLEQAKNVLFRQRNQALEQSGRLPKGAIGRIQKTLQDASKKTAGLDIDKKFANDLQRLSRQRGVKGLTEFRQTIDDQINFARSSGSVSPKTETFYRQLRKSIDDELADLAPGIKATNSQLADMYDLEDLLQDATKRQFAGGGRLRAPLLGTRAPKGSTEALQMTAGKAMRPGPAGQAITQSPSGIAGRVGVGANLLGDEIEQPESLEEALAQTGTVYGESTGTTQFDELGAGQQSGITEEQFQNAMLVDLQETGGENFDKIQQLYELFGPQSTQAPELNNTAITAISDTQAGISQLDKLAQTYKDSSANFPVLGRLRGLNPFDTESQAFDSQLRLTRQIIGKALEGGVLRKEDEAKYTAILPNRGDTDESALAKLEFIKNDIQQKLDQFMQNQSIYGGDGSLEDALLTVQGGAYGYN